METTDPAALEAMLAEARNTETLLAAEVRALGSELEKLASECSGLRQDLAAARGANLVLDERVKELQKEAIDLQDLVTIARDELEAVVGRAKRSREKYVERADQRVKREQERGEKLVVALKITARLLGYHSCRHFAKQSMCHEAACAAGACRQIREALAAYGKERE